MSLFIVLIDKFFDNNYNIYGLVIDHSKHPPIQMFGIGPMKTHCLRLF